MRKRNGTGDTADDGDGKSKCNTDGVKEEARPPPVTQELFGDAACRRPFSRRGLALHDEKVGPCRAKDCLQTASLRTKYCVACLRESMFSMARLLDENARFSHFFFISLFFFCAGII